MASFTVNPTLIPSGAEDTMAAPSKVPDIMDFKLMTESQPWLCDARHIPNCNSEAAPSSTPDPMDFKIMTVSEQESWLRDVRHILQVYVAAEVRDNPNISSLEMHDDPRVVIAKTQKRKHLVHNFNKDGLDLLVSIIEMYVCSFSNRANRTEAAEARELIYNVSASIPSSEKAYYGIHLDVQKKIYRIEAVGELIAQHNDLEGTRMAEALLDFLSHIARCCARYAINHNVGTVNAAVIRTITQSVVGFPYSPDFMVWLY